MTSNEAVNCRHCDAQLVNGQGLYVCVDCGWTAKSVGFEQNKGEKQRRTFRTHERSVLLLPA